MPLEEEIRQRLADAFDPSELEVLNESHHHAGHAGDDGSGQSHWRVRIADPSLAGQSRIARHRAIHAALGADIIGRIHALAIEAR